MEKEILIALECILKMLRSTSIFDTESLIAREKYLDSTIKRVEEFIEGLKNV